MSRFAVGDVFAEQLTETHIVKCTVMDLLTDTGNADMDEVIIVDDHGQHPVHWTMYTAAPDEGAYGTTAHQWKATPCSVIPCSVCGGNLDLLLGEKMASQMDAAVVPPVTILEEDE